MPMTQPSPESDPATYFGFTDLHGFKDFMGYVILCAPDEFPNDDWLKPEDSMNLDRAFVGLRYGLDVTESELGETEVISTCRLLVEDAYAEYQAGRDLNGQQKLEQMDEMLRRLPSR